MAGLIAFALAVLLPVSAAAQTELRDLAGKPLSAVIVEVQGVVVSDPELLALVETRAGEALALDRVRETVDHFVGLGGFDDVRVFGRLVPGIAGESVELRWALTPVQRITRIAFEGSPGFPEGELRAALQTTGERQPPVDRVPVLLDRLRAFYAERGYRAPTITSRLVSEGAAGAELRIVIVPGSQVRVASLEVDAPSTEDERNARERLGLRVGGTYDRTEVERRASELQAQYRDRGFFEAGVSHSATDADGGVAVAVTIDPGPRVRLTFAGDPLDPGVRDELVPIQRERSVDDDLLEDAARNIQRYLRGQGYRDATVRSERSENGEELLVTFTVERGALHRLAVVNVKGSAAVPRPELTPLTALGIGAPYVDERAAAVDAALTELYRRRGFASANVDLQPTVGVLVIGEGEPFRPVELEVQIEEGPQTLVEQVVLDGAAEIPQARLRETVGLRPGAPFYQPQMVADRDAIAQLYRDEGFEQVAVSAATQPAGPAAQVNVRFTIAEGTQTRVDRLLVSGTRRISPALVRRETGLIEGQPLRDGALVDAQRRLALLGLFRRVRVSELPAGAGSGRDILIEVEEAPASTIAYGGGLEIEPRYLREGTDVPEERLLVAPRAFLELGRQNLGGKNRTLNLFTRASLRRRDPGLDAAPDDRGGYGLNEYRVVGTFREPRLFDTPGDAQLIGFLEQAIRTGFSFRRRGVRADYARRLASTFTVSARYTFDRTRLFDSEIAPDDPDQPLIDRLFPQVRLSTLTGSALRDSRDDVLDPRQGTVLGVDASLAAPAIGSEVGFVRSLAQAFSYRRLPGTSQFVLVAGARLGLAKGFAVEADDTGADGNVVGDEGAPTDLPASERFFAGGDTTVRGFALDRLGTEGTLNADGFPTGGNGLLVFNLEVRAPYWKNIGAVAFVDVGNVYRRVSSVNLDDLRGAAGFGIRYRSPIGPLRADLGFKLAPRTLSSGAREQRAVFHLSLGQAF